MSWFELLSCLRCNSIMPVLPHKSLLTSVYGTTLPDSVLPRLACSGGAVAEGLGWLLPALGSILASQLTQIASNLMERFKSLLSFFPWECCAAEYHVEAELS